MQSEEEVTGGDVWIRNQEFEVMEDDVKLRIDKFWHKICSRMDASGDCFMPLPKLVKCALAHCHSNTDVAGSLHVNKRMITKQNISLNGETIIGLIAMKSAVKSVDV